VIAELANCGLFSVAEDRLGTLGPGKVADFAVLSQGIFKVPGADLPKTESVLSIVGERLRSLRMGSNSSSCKFGGVWPRVLSTLGSADRARDNN